MSERKIVHDEAATEAEGPVSKGLKEAISERGLTAYAAAKRAGVSVDAIQRFLKDERGLNLATVDKLAGALGLSLCPDEPS
jgi:transcriptional regulator with XRE-family HTH domain